MTLNRPTRPRRPAGWTLLTLGGALASLCSLVFLVFASASAQESDPAPVPASPAPAAPAPAAPAPLAVRSGLGLELSGVARVKGGFLLADDELIGSVTWIRSLEAPRTELVKLYRRDRDQNRLFPYEDVEDLAALGNTVFVLGSHHGKRRKKDWTRRREREFLVRAGWDDDKGKLSVPARKKGKAKHEVYTELIDHLEKHHKDLTRGLNAEGLAVTETHVQIGLRAPLTREDKAVILRAKVKDLFGPKRKDFDGDFERIELDLGKQGIRALFWDAKSKRLLIVSGAVFDDPESSCGLWTYELGGGDSKGGAQEGGTLERIASFPSAHGTLEALCRLDDQTLLLAFDSDATQGRLLRWTWKR